MALYIAMGNFDEFGSVQDQQELAGGECGGCQGGGKRRKGRKVRRTRSKSPVSGGSTKRKRKGKGKKGGDMRKSLRSVGNSVSGFFKSIGSRAASMFTRKAKHHKR